MRPLQNTLYVTNPEAYVRLRGRTVLVEVDGKKQLQVPLHHLGAIVCFDRARVSQSLLCHCACEGRTVAWLDRRGRFLARVEGPQSGNVLLRMAQHSAATDVTSSLEISRAIVAGKIQNSRQILVRGAREASASEERQTLGVASRTLARILKSLKRASDANIVLGYEGEAARTYYGVFNLLLKPRTRQAFAMERRTRRPPRDPLNSVLSFLYALLQTDCKAALETVGLDPQLGFFHRPRPGRNSLALDLMEEFRSVLADRLTLTLINRGQLKQDDFDDRPGGAVFLGEDGRRTVITAYQERKGQVLKHPLLKEPVTIGLLPHIQARLLARVLRGDLETYVPFLQR